MSVIPPTPTSTPAAATQTPTTSASGADNTMIASNFTTFLTLLTTQLQNQNPLDPLDTNQFTQQLVQFAQVEQQMKSNDQLTTLVALDKTAQSTTALAYVGATVVVDGATTALGATNGASWTFNVAKPSTATITIKDSTGQTAYTGTTAAQPGLMNFNWDGRGNDGKLWPPGNYTMSVSAVDANKQSVGISTQVQAIVDSVDLSQDPPTLSINGANYTVDKIKQIVRPGFGATPPVDPPVETPAA